MLYDNGAGLLRVYNLAGLHGLHKPAAPKNVQYTDKKIQTGAVAKSCMTNGLPVKDKKYAHFLIQYIRKPFLIYDFAVVPI